MLLSTIISPRPSSSPSVLILQSSLAQSAIPLLRELIKEKYPNDKQKQTLLFCFLHPPASLLSSETDSSRDDISVYDRIESVPDFCIDDNHRQDPRDFILNSVKAQIAENSTHIHVIIDSVDTILSDIGSASATYKFLRDLKTLVSSHSPKSHLTLHINSSSSSSSALLPSLLQVPFSSPLPFVHIIPHPPALLHFLAKEYLTPPPPASPEAKFWGVFIPVSERVSEVNRLIYGNGGEGQGGTDEFIVEILRRGAGESRGNGRLERVIEGWDSKRCSAVELTALECLKAIFRTATPSSGPIDETPNPAQNLSFNLNLTESQQEARAQVPLPYAHEGQPKAPEVPASGAILYDPDSGDDIDDDDPDEDLDI